MMMPVTFYRRSRLIGRAVENQATADHYAVLHVLQGEGSNLRRRPLMQYRVTDTQERSCRRRLGPGHAPSDLTVLASRRAPKGCKTARPRGLETLERLETEERLGKERAVKCRYNHWRGRPVLSGMVTPAEDDNGRAINNMITILSTPARGRS